MKRRIDWTHVARLSIGSVLCLLSIVLVKVSPSLPIWIWGLVGACGVVLVAFEMPQAGQQTSEA